MIFSYMVFFLIRVGSLSANLCCESDLQYVLLIGGDIIHGQFSSCSSRDFFPDSDIYELGQISWTVVLPLKK